MTPAGHETRARFLRALQVLNLILLVLAAWEAPMSAVVALTATGAALLLLEDRELVAARDARLTDHLDALQGAFTPQETR